LREAFSIKRACKAAGITRFTYYNWCRKYPDFNEATASAIEDGTDELEDRARTRAMKSSDQLMMFLLGGRRPAKYRKGEGKDDTNVTVVIKGGLPDVPVPAEDAPAPADTITTSAEATS
jgi:hypothetical protein